MDNNNSGVNTIILVIILALIVFGMVWFFKGQATPEEGLNVDVNIPTENNGSGDGGE